MRNPNNPDISLESVLLQKGFKRVIGIDEAGRGAWAGPVTVGAYVFDMNTKFFPGIKDSKLITPKVREVLYSEIFDKKNCIIEIGDIGTINEIGIGKAIKKLIEKIIENTYSKDTFYLIDGVFSQDFTQNSRQIIKGDMLHYSISCASILAKVFRDRILVELSKLYPEYFLNEHKGYGTQKHLEALKIYGISKIHRLNYKPIAKLMDLNDKNK